MGKEKKPIIIETVDIYLHFPYIMEEEADDLVDFLEEEHIEYEGATDIFIDLQNQVKKQKEVIDKAINELFILKDMIYKPETREENFEIQRKISSLIKRLNGKEVSE